MNFHSHQIILIKISFLLSISSAQNLNSTPCTHTCGQNRVQYPFGFSDGCPIKLNCNTNTSSSIQIGTFSVQNVTNDQILISLPSKCDRPILQFSEFFGDNFAPTWRNGLLLENCSSPINDCGVPSRLAESRLAFEACGSTSNENVSCYADDGSEFLDYGKVKSKLGNCSALFSSIMVGFGESVGTVSLEFQTLELGWWLNGDCNCDRNANCTPIDRGLSRKGFRCNCNEGYVGDGFADGEGCNQVSDCSARRYLSVGCGGTRVGVLIGGIIAGASLVAALTFICYCMKKRSTILRNRLSARRLLSEVAGNSNVPFYPYKEIEKATNGFSEKQRLGTGAYGTVYAGKLHSKWVAIKKIRHRDKDSVEQVMNEIKLLSSVSHPNLVRLLGCCIENTEQILVYEYMPNGTLSQHLQRERGSVLPWTTTISTQKSQTLVFRDRE
ncbi:hypothetical protein RD792_016729 [Penstemon davidsonii]|uniref:Protein kinase domain-containing protein n=1 Tax=Penstemon davidsonii TaxID=160366 RepID=A0ABR0CMP6_9LAMI|nr:hypothetical protein RD792_016729 [Penstemon davidsonii]